MKIEQPDIVVIFVPTNCTGVFQPCDVLLQQLFKLSIRESANKNFWNFMIDQLKNGAKDTEILLPSKLDLLRDATP